MKRSLLAGALFAAALGNAQSATAQAYYPLFHVQPAMPETMPTVSPYHDELSGTAKPTIAATPDCGAATPQRGIPSMLTGTCP
jgi:hypothetical protein